MYIYTVTENGQSRIIYYSLIYIVPFYFRLVKPFQGVDKDVLRCFQNEAVSQLETNIQVQYSNILAF